MTAFFIVLAIVVSLAFGWYGRGIYENLHGYDKIREADRRRGLAGYVTAYAIMKTSTRDQNIGEITTNENKARARARQARAEGDFETDLVQYQATKVLEV